MNTSGQKKWVSLAIYGDQFEKILVHVLVPFIEEYKGELSQFIFNRSRERGDNLLLMFESSSSAVTDLIKFNLNDRLKDYLKTNPYPLKEIEAPVMDWFLPFQNNHIEYNDNFLFDIMETGGLHASFLAQDFFHQTSKLLLSFFEATIEEGWDPESSIGLALQIQLSFISSFGMSLDDIQAFYKWTFSNITEKIQGENEDFKTALLEGLDDNFSEQKDDIVGYIGFLLETFDKGEAFDEEWLNDFHVHCKQTAVSLKALQNNNTYFTPENFEIDSLLTVDKDVQELWPIMEYYVRAVNSQMGIMDGVELNLLYTLMRGTSCIEQPLI